MLRECSSESISKCASKSKQIQSSDKSVGLFSFYLSCSMPIRPIFVSVLIHLSVPWSLFIFAQNLSALNAVRAGVLGFIHFLVNSSIN